MEFLKSLVPAVISGEGAVEHGGAVPKEPGPRLLRMKRLGLLVMGQTIDEDPVDSLMQVYPGVSSSRPGPSNRANLKGTTDTTRVGALCTSADSLCHFVGASCHLHVQFCIC